MLFSAQRPSSVVFGHAYIVNVSVRILHNFEVNDIVYAVKHEMRLLDETSSRCALEDHPCCLHYTHMETRLCLCPSVLNQQSICLSSLRRYPSVKVEDSRVVDPIISPPGKERCRPQWVVDKDCSLDFWDVVGREQLIQNRKVLTWQRSNTLASATLGEVLALKVREYRSSHVLGLFLATCSLMWSDFPAYRSATGKQARYQHDMSGSIFFVYRNSRIVAVRQSLRPWVR